MSTFRKVLIGLGAIVAIIVLIIILALYATRGLTDVINDQLVALRSGDVSKAYSYTSKDFQNVTSLPDFEKFVEHYPALKNNDKANFTSKEITEDTGTVKGTLHSKEGASTPVEYRLIKENGEWKIMGIQVSSSGLSTSPDKSPAVAESEKPVDVSTITKVYDNKDSRYSIKYPTNWEFDSTSRGTVIFSGKQGTPQYYSTINIQTVLAKKTGGDYGSVKEFMADIKRQAKKGSQNTQFLESGSIDLSPSNGANIKGEYITFTYTYRGVEFKQWQIVVLRKDGQVFYAWAYTSPVEQYNHDLPIADGMLKSWTIY